MYYSPEASSALSDDFRHWRINVCEPTCSRWRGRSTYERSLGFLPRGILLQLDAPHLVLSFRVLNRVLLKMQGQLTDGYNYYLVLALMTWLSGSDGRYIYWPPCAIEVGVVWVGLDSRLDFSLQRSCVLSQFNTPCLADRQKRWSSFFVLSEHGQECREFLINCDQKEIPLSPLWSESLKAWCERKVFLLDEGGFEGVDLEPIFR